MILEDGVVAVISLCLGMCLIYAHLFEGFPQLYACSGYLFMIIGFSLSWGRGFQALYLWRTRHERKHKDVNSQTKSRDPSETESDSECDE